jgi:hypothetical protein
LGPSSWLELSVKIIETVVILLVLIMYPWNCLADQPPSTDGLILTIPSDFDDASPYTRSDCFDPLLRRRIIDDVGSLSLEPKFEFYVYSLLTRLQTLANQSFQGGAPKVPGDHWAVVGLLINRHGELCHLVIEESSGSEEFNDRVIHLVTMTSPFARFPPSVAEEIDVLYLRRMWKLRR